MATTEKVNCNFCKADKCKVVYSEGKLKLVKCGSCGFNYVNPRIKIEDLMEHYDENHTIGAEAARRKLKNASPEQQVVTDQSRWSQKQWNALNGWLWDDLRRVMRHKKGGRLLDVGCGDGARLQVALEHGWKDLYGLEVSDAAIEKLKKRFSFPDGDKRFKNASIIKSGFPENSFDVITYWSVLEHVVDPLENLQKANSLLKKSGILAIRVPNVREEFFRKYQTNFAKFIMPLWLKKLCGVRDLRQISFNEISDLTLGTSGSVGGLDLELHVNHFNDDTLCKFLNESEFKVLENGVGEEPFLLQEINIKTITQAFTRAFSQIPYYCTFCRRFNFSQQLFFIAQKK